MDRLAGVVLHADVNGDGGVDRRDLLAWRPRADADKLSASSPDVQTFIRSIHRGTVSSANDLKEADALLRAGAGVRQSLDQKGQIVFAADGRLGLSIVDVGDPDRAALNGSLRTQGQALGVTVDNNIAYIAEGRDGVGLVSVSDPANPSPMLQVSTSGEARGVAVRGATLYIADSVEGVVVLDVSNPTSPQKLGTVPVAGTALGVAIDAQDPKQLRVPVELADGSAAESIFSITRGGGVVLEGTVGPDPGRPPVGSTTVPGSSAPPGSTQPIDGGTQTSSSTGRQNPAQGNTTSGGGQTWLSGAGPVQSEGVQLSQ